MKLRQICLDTETTGIDAKSGHRIIEIGCVELIERRLTGQHFHVYINPDREIDEGAKRVHGITEDFLQDKPKFIEICDEFFAFIDGAQLIIHNASFDIGFINEERKRLGRKLKAIESHCSVVDTLAMARKLYPGQKNNLDALCKRLSIDNSHRVLHGALMDAQILAHVYLAMTSGQDSLFREGESTTTQVSLERSDAMVMQVEGLTIYRASPEELVEHKQRLTEISAAIKGKTLWEEVID